MTNKAIIAYEALSGRAFHEIDYTDPKQVDMLLYANHFTTSEEPKPYELYCKMLANSPMVRSRELDRITASLLLMQQMQADCRQEGVRDGEAPSMGDLCAMLIVEGGLDAHYVMHELPFYEIPIYLKAIEQKKRSRMEEGRLWTYYTILPHVGTKDMKKPSDMLVFPWEQEQEAPSLELTELLNEAYYGGE